MSELNQLLLNFNQKQNFNFNDYYVGKSNYFAYKLIETWPKWTKKIINIYGEKGSGKTHLSSIFQKKNKAKIIEEKNINFSMIKSLKVYQNIILENYENSIDEKILFTFLKFVDQDNKFLIINSNKPLTKFKFKLPDLISRINNILLAEIKDPEDEMIFALILKNFSDRQLNVEKKLIDYVVKRIERSYSKISQFIYKIDEISLKKKKRIDLKTIKEII